ncbi:MAG: hypothetical protein JO262_03955 [Solirubrobacterales bacterium]|nr:hypothetical protein [Solirubrobacterales bacterium]
MPRLVLIVLGKARHQRVEIVIIGYRQQPVERGARFADILEPIHSSTLELK